MDFDDVGAQESERIHLAVNATGAAGKKVETAQISDDVTNPLSKGIDAKQDSQVEVEFVRSILVQDSCSLERCSDH